MILADGLIPFLLHLESYLVLVNIKLDIDINYVCLLSILGSKPQDNVNLCFLSFCRHIISCCMQNGT